MQELAQNEWKISGVSAQPILVELRNKGSISKPEYTEAVARLALFNYRFIEIDADAVLWVLDRVQYRVTADVTQILGVFHGPHCTFESTVEVLGEVTKRLWIASGLYHLKIDMVDAILDALGTNRPTNEAAAAFSETVKLKFFLIPKGADAIVERARLWKEGKLGRTGIIVPSQKTEEG